MKKRRFDLDRSLDRELNLAVYGVLSMTGSRGNIKPDGRVLFSIGDCVMGKPGRIGYYSTFSRYLIEQVRAMGYKVVFNNEYYTSQMFPGTGEKTEYSGVDSIRIKYAKVSKVHIHRDVMAAENLCDIQVAILKSIERPSYLCKAASI